MEKTSQSIRSVETADSPGIARWLRAAVYASFFLSGATALIFEVLWSRQFVTVFGNSSYAISVVLCAFMVGLGIGGWLGGRLADRYSRRLLMYGCIQMSVALWALLMPVLLGSLRGWIPRLSALSGESLAVSSASRFLISFVILFVPCALMGATLPLMSRFCARTRDVIGRRIGLLYGLNTLGATLGCFLAGFWMIQTLGLSLSNDVAIGINLAIAAFMFLLGRPAAEGAGASGRSAGHLPAGEPLAKEDLGHRDRTLLLGVSFFSGMLGLSCQVLWVRFLSFSSLTHTAYAFPAVLGIYLLGLAIGSLIYRFLLARYRQPTRILAWVLLAAGWAILLFLIAAVLGAPYGGTPPMNVLTMAAIAVLVPTIVMGIVFPLVCAAFAGSVATVGRGVGAAYAANTAGSMVGALIPVFVLVPLLGIQLSIMLLALLYWAAALALFSALTAKDKPLCLVGAGAGVVTLVLVLVFVGPSGFCKGVFLSGMFAEGNNLEIAFYREGRTGTAIIVRDRISDHKIIYIDSNLEVPNDYAAISCFKLLGDLGPLLHADPADVLMICLGGGIAGGAAVQNPDVKSLEVVDLENSVIEACRLFKKENNGLLDDPRVHVIVDDGRNYILTSRKKWPVIVSDSSHPKSPDSWVLYTQEFYRAVKDHLTGDGVFVQWLPIHALTISEYKTLVRTFQSVFPHASLWLTYGMNPEGPGPDCFTLMVATPRPLSVDVELLRRKLSAPAVRADLEPLCLDSVPGVLENFLCAEDTLREWVGPGPVNTDDLPYTQYRTVLARGTQCRVPAFAAPLESIWPYLRNVGNEREAAALKEELALRRKAVKFFLGYDARRALREFPGDRKMRKLVEDAEATRQYVYQLARYAWDCAPALRGLAITVAGSYGDPEAGVALCRRAMTLEPKDPSSRFCLGRILCQSGRLDEGLSEVRQALALRPDSAGGRLCLGLFLVKAGRTEEGIAEYQRAVALDPDNDEAHFLLGESFAASGRPAEAVGCFRRALALNPDYSVARAELGIALVEKGEFQEGVEQFGAALRGDPFMLPERCKLGRLMARLGRPDEASALFSEALKVDPEYEPARRALAEIPQRASGGR